MTTLLRALALSAVLSMSLPLSVFAQQFPLTGKLIGLTDESSGVSCGHYLRYHAPDTLAESGMIFFVVEFTMNGASKYLVTKIFRPYVDVDVDDTAEIPRATVSADHARIHMSTKMLRDATCLPGAST